MFSWMQEFFDNIVTTQIWLFVFLGVILLLNIALITIRPLREWIRFYVFLCTFILLLVCEVSFMGCDDEVPLYAVELADGSTYESDEELKLIGVIRHDELRYVTIYPKEMKGAHPDHYGIGYDVFDNANEKKFKSYKAVEIPEEYYFLPFMKGRLVAISMLWVLLLSVILVIADIWFEKADKKRLKAGRRTFLPESHYKENKG